MPKLNFSKDGKVFLECFDFRGGLSSIDYNPDTFLTFTNLEPKDDGTAEKRGAMAIAGANIYLDTPGSQALFVHDGEGTTDTAYAAYAGVNSGGTLTIKGVNVNGDRATVFSATATGTPSTKPVYKQIDGKVYFGDALDSVLQFGGTSHAVVTSGSTTMTFSGRTVTASASTFTADHLGSFIVSTGDSAATISAYRIIEVVSGTVARIDRTFAGSAAGPTTSWRMRPAEYYYCTNSIFYDGTNTNVVVADLLESHASRVFVADTSESESSQKRNFPNRLRWSGLIGSTEGTAPHIGVQAFHASGYKDFPYAINDIASFNGTLLVFTTKGIFACVGETTLSTTGSMDFTTFWGDIVVSRGCVTKTPFGIAFYDSNGVGYLWNGTGRPQDITQDRVKLTDVSTPSGIGYYKQHLVFSGTAGAGGIYFIYDTRKQCWFKWTTTGTTDAIWGWYQRGGDFAFAQYKNGSNHTVLMNTHYMFTRGAVGSSTYRDENAVAAFLCSLKTTHLGNPMKLLRMRNMVMCYRMLDQGGVTPTLTATVKTGLPGAENASSETVTFPINTTLETEHKRLINKRDPMVQVTLDEGVGSSTNVSNTGSLLIIGFVIEMEDVGVGDST